jgi:hypothetical protein
MQGHVFAEGRGSFLFMRRSIVAGICVLAGWSACAEPVVLGDETLKQAIAGKTVHLDTPLGVAIPIAYHGNGLMSGKAGVLEYFLGAEADRGRWWVADGKLCQKWFKWLDAQPSCMRLKQDGSRIYWRRDDGVSGTATIATGLPSGAETGPRGLGGPVQTPQLSHSLMGAEPREPARPATSSKDAAPVHRQLEAAAPRAATAIAQPPLQRPPSGVNGRPRSAVHDRLAMATAHDAWTGQDNRWCHSVLPPAIGTHALPDLVMVARLSYTGGELPSPAHACLAAEPALRRLAKQGIDAR